MSDIIINAVFRTNDDDLENTEKLLNDIEDSLKNVSSSDDLKQLSAEFDNLNAVVDESTLSFSEMGKVIEQYQTIALKAGTESPIGQEAINRAASMKQEVDELTRSVDSLSQRGQNLQATLQLSEGLVAGYGAFLGLTALLGDENEDLAQTFVKLQAVQATLMSVEQIRLLLQKDSILVQKAQEYWNGLLIISERILIKLNIQKATEVKGATAATKGLAGAMAGLGIGLVVAALGYLISALGDSTEATEEMTEANRNLNNSFLELQDQISANIQYLDLDTKRKILHAKQIGATEREITEIIRQSTGERIVELEREADAAAKNLDDILAASYQFGITTQELRESGQVNALVAPTQEEIDEAWDLYFTAQNQFIDAQISFLDKERDIEQKANEQKKNDNKETNEAMEDEGQRYFESRGIQLEGLVALERKAHDWELDDIKRYLDEKKRLEEEDFQRELEMWDNRIGIASHFGQSVTSIFEGVFEVTNNLGKQSEEAQLNRAKRQFAWQKTLAIVEAGINTAQGVTQSIAMFGPPIPPNGLGIAGVASVLGLGATQIAAIASKQFQGGSNRTPSVTDGISNSVNSASSSMQNINNFGNTTTQIDPSTGMPIGGSGISPGTKSGMVPVLVLPSYQQVEQQQAKIKSLATIS